MALFEEMGEMLGGGSNLGALAGFLGADNDKAAGLLGMAGPAILGALGKRSASPAGADALFGLANNADAGILDNLGGFLGGGDAGGIGGQLVGSLLGSKRGAVESGLAQQAGVGGGMVSKLLPMLAPIAMSFLKKKIMGGGMNASGLAGLLGDNTKAMRSGGLGGILDMLDGDDEADDAGFLDGIKSMAGLGGATAAVGAVAGKASGMAGNAASSVSSGADDVRSAMGEAGKGGGLPKWLVPAAALAALLIALFLIFGRGGGDDVAVGAENCDSVDDVSLQLQWFAQGQFAGYYAAVDEGFYADRCLNVTILEGGLDIVPQQQLASGNADFAISWVPKALVSREEGLDIVNVAQIFQRSGTLQVAYADAGINSPADLAGRQVGSWGFGNEFELLAGSRAAGVEPGEDYDIVGQNFDMFALISGEIDAAQAMIYNEYAQVLETVNPDTGELFTADDFSVIDWNEEGAAMLQDAIWADGSRLGDAEFDDITTRFVAASIEGWAWCRAVQGACVDVVMANGPTLGRSHQSWQVNQVNGLIWPAPDGAGIINQALWDQTIDIATSEGVLAGPPDAGAFTNTYAVAAIALVEANGVDAVGAGFEVIEVTLNEGGE